MAKQKKEELLKRIYFTPSDSAGYGGKHKLIKSVKRKVQPRQVSDWLRQIDTYTLHKPAKKRFLRRKYITSDINFVWQADLADLPNIAKYNDNYKFILFTIDVFSRKAYARALKSKSGESVTEAFQDILNVSKANIKQLNTDKGKEWFNMKFQQMLKANKIHHYLTYSQETKGSLIERLLRTIKSKMFRYFTHTNSMRYIDILQQLIDSYNNSVHRSLGITPNQVTAKNQEQLWHKLYTEEKLLESRPKFKIGDTVRISKYSKTFQKSYIASWSQEIFTVSKIIYSNPKVYTLCDEANNELEGTFYEQELQKVNVKDNIYRIESILGKRKINGKTQYLIKWAGYGPEFNSYVDQADVIANYKN